jgi:hypothetical protein
VASFPGEGTALRPELTVEVTFLGWEAGRLRHATLGHLG